MRFEICGHACLKVTENGTGLIVDPWLVGSCYGRSCIKSKALRHEVKEP